MAECSININRRTINSIETPECVDVEVGDDVVLKLINNGSPLHVTVSVVNARRFTLFLHENIYLKENMEFHIPIFSTAPTGSFQIEIITGYGIVKESFKVNVHDKEIEIPDVFDEIPSPNPEKSKYLYPLAILSFMIAGWAAYGAGYLYYGYTAGFASVILLSMAVVFAWRCRP
ncbi:MAG: hypothetical protein JXQ82_06815 [Methanomicrobiaceae archaeon]|nr:hypothetical protein [Methanomicrobiaceae archaeon]